jgi:hypothetical protein
MLIQQWMPPQWDEPPCVDNVAEDFPSDDDNNEEVGNDREFNFGEAPSNEHINSVVDDIHGDQEEKLRFQRTRMHYE